MASASCYQLPLFPPEKHCALCGQWRELSAFTRDKRAPDGLQAWCKPCRAAYYVAYRRGCRMKIAVPAGMKFCTPCQTVLPVDCFGHNRAAKDGCQSYCKACRARRSTQERVDRRGGQIRSQSKRLALMPAEKHCPKCGLTKPCVGFYVVPGRPDGLTGVCRECAKAEARQRVRTYSARYAAAKKAWLAAHPTFNRDYLRRWYAAHPGKMREYRRKHFDADPEAARAKARAYWPKRKTRPGYKLGRRRAEHARRSRETGTERTLTAAQWHAHLDAIGHRCLCCDVLFSEEAPATIDHIVPVSRGGGLTLANSQGLCAHCNLLKGTRTTDYRPVELR